MSKKIDQIRAKREIANPSPLPSVNSGSSNQIYDRFNPEAGGIIEQTGGDYLGNYSTPFIGYDGPVGSNGKPTISQKDYGTFLSNGKSSSITSKVVAGPVSPFATTTNAAMYSPTVYRPRPLMKTAGATTTDPNNPFKKKEEEQQQITLKPVVDKINPVKKITPESELTNKFGIDTKGWTGEQYNQRNDRIAYDLIGGGVQNEQGVRNNLMQYDSFKGASAQDQNNTIQQILGRIGSQNARTGEVDQIAQQIGYKDFRDFSAKAGSAVAGQVNALINDIQSYKAQGDVTGESYARAALADVMAQGKNLDVEESIRNTDSLVALSKMNPQAAGVVEQYNLVQNLMGQGIDYNDIPKYIGKDQQYVNALLGGEWNKLGVQLTPEMENEVFAKMKLDKEQLDMDNIKKKEAIALQMERNTQDFLKAADRQRADNQVQKDNMSKLARMTGVGYSSAGVEGMDRVFEQGRQAMQDLQDLHSRSSYDLQKQLADVSDAYIYNTKVYDLSYKDSMKNITNSFMQDVQQIQGRFGKNSAAALDNITKTTTTYMSNLAELGMFREKQQADLNNDLWSRRKDAANLELDQQKLNLQYQEFGLKQLESQQKANATAAAQPFNRNQQITTIKNIASQSGNMQQFAQGVAQLPDGMKGGQCGAFANDIAVGMGLPKLFADSLKDKLKVRNSTTPTVGSFVIMDTGVKLKNGEKAGHVSYIVGINKDGTAIVKDSNRAGDERIGTHTINLNNKQIMGYVDPNKKTTSIPKGAKEDSLPSASINGLSPNAQAQLNSKTITSTGKAKDAVIEELQNAGAFDEGQGNLSYFTASPTTKKEINDFKAGQAKRQEFMNIYNKLTPGQIDSMVGLFGARKNKTLSALGGGNKDFIDMNRMLQKELSTYMSKISGATVGDNEVKRLSEQVPNTNMGNKEFKQAVKDYNNSIENAKQNLQYQYGLGEQYFGGSGTNNGTPPTIVNKYKSR